MRLPGLLPLLQYLIVEDEEQEAIEIESTHVIDGILAP
jgi:hypothetical protein